MLKTVRKAFQIEDIRKRIFYTFVMLVIVRLGSQLPTPGVDPTFIKEFFCTADGGRFATFLKRSTGGSFTNFSIFCMSHSHRTSLHPLLCSFSQSQFRN